MRRSQNDQVEDSTFSFESAKVGVMADQPLNKPTPVKLFEFKSGSVRATVFGPRIGFRWRTIKYYRWQRSAKIPGEWLEATAAWRDKDNPHLAKCVAAVQQYLEQE